MFMALILLTCVWSLMWLSHQKYITVSLKNTKVSLVQRVTWLCSLEKRPLMFTMINF